MQLPPVREVRRSTGKGRGEKDEKGEGSQKLKWGLSHIYKTFEDGRREPMSQGKNSELTCSKEMWGLGHQRQETGTF